MIGQKQTLNVQFNLNADWSVVTGESKEAFSSDQIKY
jgi:hypothetical protein